MTCTRGLQGQLAPFRIGPWATPLPSAQGWEAEQRSHPSWSQGLTLLAVANLCPASETAVVRLCGSGCVQTLTEAARAQFPLQCIIKEALSNNNHR